MRFELLQASRVSRRPLARAAPGRPCRRAPSRREKRPRSPAPPRPHRAGALPRRRRTPARRALAKCRRGRLAHADRAGETDDEHHEAPRCAATWARSSGVTSGRTPNQRSKPGTAWCSSMPSPSTVRFPACLGGGKERGLERAIDDVGDDGVGGKHGKVDVERRLARHAEAGGVDQEPAAGERAVPLLPRHRRDRRPEALPPRPRPGRPSGWRAGSSRPPPRSGHAGWRAPHRRRQAPPPAACPRSSRAPRPSRLRHEAIGVGVARMEQALAVEPQRVRRADGRRRVVAAGRRRRARPPCAAASRWRRRNPRLPSTVRKPSISSGRTASIS